MTTSRSLPDPLLQSVTASVGGLPSAAAREARRVRDARVSHRRAVGGGFFVFLACFTIWQGRHQLSVTRTRRAAITARPPAATQQTQVASPEFVIATIPGQSSSPAIPIPPVISEAQRVVILAAGDLPLLLVKDDSGRVTRIHVIER